MAKRIASAVFDNHPDAERAVTDLRSAGIPDRHISMLRRDEDHPEHADTKASGAAKGAGVGAGVGAVAGLAALAIPGVGPFLAMGAVAEAIGVIGSAAATSAVVGAAAGGIAGALMHYGVSEEEARYYDERLREGGTWVGVDTSDPAIDHDAVEQILYKAGGHSASRRSAAEAY